MTQADPKSDVVDLGRADDTNALKPRASRRVRRTDGKYRLAVDLLLDDEASYAAARTLLYVIKAGGNSSVARTGEGLTRIENLVQRTSGAVSEMGSETSKRSHGIGQINIGLSGMDQAIQ